MNQPVPRAQWSSRLGFILAAAGSAVGLGNIWKFPYIAGMNGGGAFVLVYLLCVLAVGLPIMLAELMLGRHCRRNAVGAYMQLQGPRSPWRLAGWLSVGGAFVILSYYSVVAGWTLHYAWISLTGSFAGRSPEAVEGLFGALMADGPRQLLWHLLFMSLCLGIVIGGVKEGIERWSRILMPALFGLLVLLLVNGLMSEGAAQGIAFMFRPDFHRLSAGAVLEALGHAFFTLSLGMATMLTYGSYLSRDENLLSVSLRVVFLDTLIALMAGLAIFSVVFSLGMEPAAGPGLVFKSIPQVFARIPGGSLLAIAFFLLLAFAALTSAISLLEAPVAYFIDERGWSRCRATLLLSLLVFVAGIPSALSFNLLGSWKIFGDRGFFDSIDLLASNYLLPLGGLCVALYVGWFWRKESKRREFAAGGAGWYYGAWHLLIRYLAPAAVGLVLYFKILETGLLAWVAELF